MGLHDEGKCRVVSCGVVFDSTLYLYYFFIFIFRHFRFQLAEHVHSISFHSAPPPHLASQWAINYLEQQRVERGEGQGYRDKPESATMSQVASLGGADWSSGVRWLSGDVENHKVMSK